MHYLANAIRQLKVSQIGWYLIWMEAVVQRCSVEKVFLEISQNSQENTSEFCEISNNIFLHRNTSGAASCLDYV